MNNHDYQDLPAISSHWLIAMLDSPAACWRKYLDPQRPAEEPTDAMRFGTLVHCLALTPAAFAREFAVMHCERRSKADRARWEWIQAQGLTPIRPAELDKARAIVAALQADPEPASCCGAARRSGRSFGPGRAACFRSRPGWTFTRKRGGRWWN